MKPKWITTSREETRRKAENRRKMKEMCAKYNPQPVAAMTDEEILEFVGRLTEDAEKTMRLRDEGGIRRKMNDDESVAFAAAINDAIAYFNRREAERQRILQYREACRQIESEHQRIRLERRKNAADFVIHIKL